MEGICRSIGRKAKEWAQSVRCLDELADTTGVDILNGHYRPMVAIKAEKLERARFALSGGSHNTENKTTQYSMLMLP